MKIINFHAHVYPDKIAEKATQSISDFYNIKGEGMCGKVSELLILGEEAGIEKHIILPVTVKARHSRSINEFSLSVKNSHPEIETFACFHAEQKDIENEIDYILSNDFKGIKIHPDFQGFNIDDERLFPLYEAVEGKKPIMFHLGDEKLDFSNPVRLRRVLDKFPRLTAISAHLGGYTKWEMAHEYLKDTSCYFDISSTLMFLEEEKVKKYINSYGSERILYGDDYPIWNPKTQVESFMRFELSDKDRENIAYKNAERLLNLKK